MRCFLIITLGLAFASCDLNGNAKKPKAFKSPKDSLNGNYEEVISVMGSPVSVNYYEDYQLVLKGTFEKGYLNDLMTVDSLGSTIEHLPIVVWTNPDKLENLDTLNFEIRNFDSLTFYQYFYATTLTKFALEEHLIRKQKPINAEDNPYIKIPASELTAADMIYIKCGVLVSVTDSATTATHLWGYFMNEFELQ